MDPQFDKNLRWAVFTESDIWADLGLLGQVWLVREFRGGNRKVGVTKNHIFVDLNSTSKTILPLTHRI